jgi:ABC-type dipeptide/oligopeptide/nickel transport system permease component
MAMSSVFLGAIAGRARCAYDPSVTRSDYLLWILLRALGTLLLASILLYAFTHIIPGDPIRALFGFRPPPPDVLTELRGQYGLDDPFYLQYLKFLRNAAQMNFGLSTRGGPVQGIVLSGLPVSLRLAALAIGFQIVVGIGLGVLSALAERPILRRLIGAVTIAILAVPILVIAYALRTYIGYDLGWLPISGVSQGWPSYILPTLALAAGATALTARMTSNQIGAVRSNPFVVSARAKGLSNRRVIAVHVLRASLIPIITFIAASAAQILGGLIIVEAVFNIPGIGASVVDAIEWKDHNLIMAIVTLGVVFSIASNAAGDVLCAAADPRVGTSALAGSKGS